jgi:hypothetical protein
MSRFTSVDKPPPKERLLKNQGVVFGVKREIIPETGMISLSFDLSSALQRVGEPWCPMDRTQSPIFKAALAFV